VVQLQLVYTLLQEQQLQMERQVNLQQDSSFHQEALLVQEMAIHLFPPFIHTSELLRLAVQVHPITQSFIQTSEPPKALVRQRPETKQRFFTLHLEQHLQVEQVQRHLKKRAHSLELLQLLVMVLQHQKNCEPSLELVPHQVSLARSHHSDTEKLELGLRLVGRPLTMKHSSFIPQSEQQAEMVMALQHPLRLRLLLERQALQAKALMQHLVCTSRQELLMAQVLEIH
jgi:hypothetical protein